MSDAYLDPFADQEGDVVGDTGRDLELERKHIGFVEDEGTTEAKYNLIDPDEKESSIPLVSNSISTSLVPVNVPVPGLPTLTKEPGYRELKADDDFVREIPGVKTVDFKKKIFSYESKKSDVSIPLLTEGDQKQGDVKVTEVNELLRNILETMTQDQDLFLHTAVYFANDGAIKASWADLVASKSKFHTTYKEAGIQFTSVMKQISLEEMGVEGFKDFYEQPTPYKPRDVIQALKNYNIKVLANSDKVRLPLTSVNDKSIPFYTMRLPFNPAKPSGDNTELIQKDVLGLKLVDGVQTIVLDKELPYFTPNYKTVKPDHAIVNSVLAQMRVSYYKAMDDRTYMEVFYRYQKAYLELQTLVSTYYYGTRGIEAQAMRLSQLNTLRAEVERDERSYGYNPVAKAALAQKESLQKKGFKVKIPASFYNVHAERFFAAEPDGYNYRKWKATCDAYFPLCQRYFVIIPSSNPVLAGAGLSHKEYFIRKQDAMERQHGLPFNCNEVNSQATAGPMFNSLSGQNKRGDPIPLGADLILPPIILQAAPTMAKEHREKTLGFTRLYNIKPKQEVYKRGEKNRNVMAPHSFVHIIPQILFSIAHKDAPTMFTHPTSRVIHGWSPAHGGVWKLMKRLRFLYKRAGAPILFIYADNLWIYFQSEGVDRLISLDGKRMEACHSRASLTYETHRILQTIFKTSPFKLRLTPADFKARLEAVDPNSTIDMKTGEIQVPIPSDYKGPKTAHPTYKAVTPLSQMYTFTELSPGWLQLDWYTYMQRVFIPSVTEAVGLIGSQQVPIPGLPSGAIGTMQFNSALMAQIMDRKVSHEEAQELFDSEDDEPNIPWLHELETKAGVRLTVENRGVYSTKNTGGKLDMLGFDYVNFEVGSVKTPIAVLNRTRALKSLIYHKFQIPQAEKTTRTVLESLLRYVTYNALYLLYFWSDPVYSEVVRIAAHVALREVGVVDESMIGVIQQTISLLLKEEPEVSKYDSTVSMMSQDCMSGTIYALSDILRIFGRQDRFQVANEPSAEISYQDLREYFLHKRPTTKFPVIPTKTVVVGTNKGNYPMVRFEMLKAGGNYSIRGAEDADVKFNDLMFVKGITDGQFVKKDTAVFCYDALDSYTSEKSRVWFYAPCDGRISGFVHDQLYFEPIPNMAMFLQHGKLPDNYRFEDDKEMPIALKYFFREAYSLDATKFVLIENDESIFRREQKDPRLLSKVLTNKDQVPVTLEIMAPRFKLVRTVVEAPTEPYAPEPTPPRVESNLPVSTAHLTRPGPTTKVNYRDYLTLLENRLFGKEVNVALPPNTVPAFIANNGNIDGKQRTAAFDFLFGLALNNFSIPHQVVAEVKTHYREASMMDKVNFSVTLENPWIGAYKAFATAREGKINTTPTFTYKIDYSKRPKETKAKGKRVKQPFERQKAETKSQTRKGGPIPAKLREKTKQKSQSVKKYRARARKEARVQGLTDD